MPSKRAQASPNITGLRINNEVCFDKATCAEKFDEFYTSDIR